ncbi:MAG TPA: hypothetical protein VM511_09845 [Luteolibacter sp.]|jgi:hypothetical protein|nr:hypothetical protein [Luteolibacter sp.]
MKTLIPILFLLCAGWLAADEPTAAIPKAEEYRATEYETWQELGKQIVPVADLEHGTLVDVIRVCRLAQTKSPEEGGIVFADAPPELTGKTIDFDWSTLRTTEVALSELIRRAAENGKATLVQEGRSVLFKAMNYAVVEKERAFGAEEIEVKNWLERVIIPRVELTDTTLSEAAEFLRMRTAEIDSLEARKGPSMLVSGHELRTARIGKLYLRNVTFWNLLHVLAEKAKAEVDIVDDIVVFHGHGSKVPDFNAKEGTLEARIKERLGKKIVPRVEYENVTLVDAVDFMRMRDAEISSEAERAERIDFRIAPELRERRISEIRIRNVSQWKLIKLFAMESGTELEFGENFVRFVEAPTPAAESDDPPSSEPVEAKGSPLMANLRWIVVGVVACVVGFSFWLTRRMARS